VSRLLIVDDKKINRQLLKSHLENAGYAEVLQAASGQEAMDMVKLKKPDLVLLDIVMPGMDGYEVCKRLKSNEQLKEVPVVFLSAVTDTRDKVKAFEQGGVDFITKPFKFEEVQARVHTHLTIHSLQRELEIKNSHLEQLVQEKVREISDTQMATIFAIARLVETRDYDTGMHLERTRNYCRLLAERLSRHPSYKATINDDFIRRIYDISPLHDIGKVGVPDAILLKLGKLTSEEFESIKKHTVTGAQYLQVIKEKFPGSAFIAMGVEIARSHHERWDGGGYPDGLRRENIPLSARIMALSDVYDALRSKRPYKEAFSHEESREIIVRESGKHFDPLIVEAFLSLETQFEQIHHGEEEIEG